MLASKPMLRRLPAAAAVALCLLLPAAPALASGDAVIRDCVKHGRLTKRYSQKEYRDALRNIPTDVDEYTDCRATIRRAQLGIGGPTNGGGSGGGTGAAPQAPEGTPSAPRADPLAGTSPQEKAAAKRDIAKARSGEGAAPQRVGPDVVTPGALAYRRFDSLSKLPTPLLVLAVLIALGALGTGAHTILHRVRSGRPGT